MHAESDYGRAAVLFYGRLAISRVSSTSPRRFLNWTFIVGASGLEGEQEVVVLAREELRLRILVNGAVALEAGVEIRQAARQLGTLGKVAEAGDQARCLCGSARAMRPW